MVAAGAKVAFAQAYWYTFLSLSSGAFRRTIYLTVFNSEMSFVVVWKRGKPFESRPATVTRASLRRASPAHSFPVLYLHLNNLSFSLPLFLPCFSSDLQQSHAHFQKETPSTPSALIIALFSPHKKNPDPSPPSSPCSAPSPTSSSQARPA